MAKRFTAGDRWWRKELKLEGDSGETEALSARNPKRANTDRTHGEGGGAQHLIGRNALSSYDLVESRRTKRFL